MFQLRKKPRSDPAAPQLRKHRKIIQHIVSLFSLNRKNQKSVAHQPAFIKNAAAFVLPQAAHAHDVPQRPPFVSGKIVPQVFSVYIPHLVGAQPLNPQLVCFYHMGSAAPFLSPAGLSFVGLAPVLPKDLKIRRRAPRFLGLPPSKKRLPICPAVRIGGSEFFPERYRSLYHGEATKAIGPHPSPGPAAFFAQPPIPFARPRGPQAERCFCLRIPPPRPHGRRSFFAPWARFRPVLRRNVKKLQIL